MELTKEYFNQKIEAQTKELKTFSRGQTEELARMVSDGFDRMERILNYEQQIKSFELKFHKLEEALHIKL